MTELKYPLFDGERLWEGACVRVENGVIASVTACAPTECGEGLLLPGLIDAHTHIETPAHVEALLRSGISAACDVSASDELVAHSGHLLIVSSAGMAMGVVMNPGGFVAHAAQRGARYIKVLLFSPLSIGRAALREIAAAAHEKGLKVAAHATEVATVRQAVEAGVDILLHVPMKESFPPELAEQIGSRGIAVAPTLVMMETFAGSGRSGYRPEHYRNAVSAVKLLREHGVAILCGTDANSGGFAPGVAYGSSLHRELELLVDAGLTPTEALTAATGGNAAAFDLRAGSIAAGMPATMALADGRPDKRITDSTRLRQLWIQGKPIL